MSLFQKNFNFGNESLGKGSLRKMVTAKNGALRKCDLEKFITSRSISSKMGHFEKVLTPKKDHFEKKGTSETYLLD